jgi:hypothetical protein
MGDHDEIIDLCSSTNYGIMKSPAIYRRTSTDFNVILQNDTPNVMNLPTYSSITNKSKSSLADSSPRQYPDPIADDSITNGYMSCYVARSPDSDSITDHHVGR